MDGFWSSRCQNYRIDVLDKVELFSSGIFFGSSTFVSQHTWKWLTVHGSMDPGQQLSCKTGVGCNSHYRSNFDLNFFLENHIANIRHNFALSRGKIWIWLLYTFWWKPVIRFYTKSELNSIKIEGVTAIFMIVHFFKNGCFYFVIYGGPKASRMARRALGAPRAPKAIRGPHSPPQEQEGGWP